MSPEILTMIQDCSKKSHYVNRMHENRAGEHTFDSSKENSTRGETSISNFLAKYQVIYMLNVCLTFRN